jgi:hypothetical protein
VLNALEIDFQHVLPAMHATIELRDLAGRNGEGLFVATGFVFQFKRADRTHGHDSAWLHRHPADHHYIDGIAVGRRCIRKRSTTMAPEPF